MRYLKEIAKWGSLSLGTILGSWWLMKKKRDDREVGVVKSMGIADEDFRVVIGRTGIEYDNDKDDYNRREHKYALESAVDLLTRWVQPVPVSTSPMMHEEVRGPEPDYEIRHKLTGFDDEKNVVVMVVTMRKGEKVRVISFRRAHKKERKQFVDELRGMVEAYQAMRR